MYADMFQKGEKFADSKKRLEKRTGLKGKSFEKIKFAVIRRAAYSKPQYLNDGEWNIWLVTRMSCAQRLLTHMQTMNFGTSPLRKTISWV
jgi:hypothetical protein